MLSMVGNGIDAWYSRWGEKYFGVYSYWKTEDARRYNQNNTLEWVTEDSGRSKNVNYTTDMNILLEEGKKEEIEKKLIDWKKVL